MSAVVEKSHPLNKLFVGLYNYLLCHKQSCMKYYFAFLNVAKVNDCALGYRMIKPYLQELLACEAPTIVISVHPMINHYLTRNRKELGMSQSVRLIEVVTDPNRNLWRAWGCNDMDTIIAPNDLARDRLVEYGVDPERIRILGMPINPIFLAPPTTMRAEFMQELGLDADKLTVCINAGWAGGGNMAHIYEKLCQSRRPVQALFLCGHNNELYSRMSKIAAQSPVKTTVLPFSDRMVDVMSHCDLMVTKAGGLTTFEALAKRLPLVFDVITEPMPQEGGTISMLLEQGLCKVVKEPGDIISIVETLEVRPDRVKQPLPTAHSLDKTAAACDIARFVLAACEPTFDFSCDTVPVQALDGVLEPVWEGI